MNILSIGTSLFSSFWRNAGHRVIVAVDHGAPAHTDTVRIDFFGKPDTVEPQLHAIIEKFQSEVIFQGDHSTPLIHCGLETVDIPKAGMQSTRICTTHGTVITQLCLILFSAPSRICSPICVCIKQKSNGCPSFCQRSSDFLPWRDRAHDVAFVGKLDATANPERVRLFEKLRNKNISIHMATGDYVPVYRSSRIVVNQSVARRFEFPFF